MLQKSSSANQRELDDFYRRINGDDFCIRTITKGAFTQARAKLSHEIFMEMDYHTRTIFYKDADYYKWGKFRLLVVDGSGCQLPSHPTIEEEFGSHNFGPNADSKKSMARISLLYDPLNCITLDAQIDAYSVSESALCKRHLQHIGKGDLVVFDRYYASFDLMDSLFNQKAHFLFRMKDNWWKVVEEFQKESTDDKLVQIQTKQGKRTVRLIKYQHKSDGQMIFCTSLVDKKKYTINDISNTYAHRWGIEEGYKTFKNWCELENFSGNTALAVKQDFYAKIFMMNLGSAYAHPISDKIKQEKKGYQLNRVQVIAATKDMPLMLFIRRTVKKAFILFDDIVSKTIEMIRPNRSFKRKKRPILKFNPNSSYKSA